jgi:endonuclease YncB( thermonuclease family)
MQEVNASLDLVSLLIVIAIVFFILRALSTLRRRARKTTKFWKPARDCRNARRRKPRQEPISSAQKDSRQAVSKTQTLNAATVKEQIECLPSFDVEQIIDGDTVIVSNTWNEVKIRLDSIDCPEDDQHWGDTATYGLIKLIGGREVRIEEHGQDHYGRTLATIYVRQGARAEWMNVNERMVTLGHAWVMRRFYGHLPNDRKSQLNRLERWARSKRVGLWKTPNPIPPWKWRNDREPPQLEDVP